MDVKTIGTQGVHTYRSQSEGVGTQGQRRQTDAVPPKAVPSGDRITVSPEARLRTEALSTAMNAPEVRQDKLAGLKERIAAGTYQVDSRNIAAKMLQNDAMLLNTLPE